VAVTLGYRSAYGTDPEHGATASLPSSDQAIDEGAPASHTGVTRPKARDRGRIYFGPVTSGAVTVTSGTPGGTVDSAFKVNLIAAFKDLAAAVSAATPSSSLVVWSRRAAGVKPVAFLYVDEGSTYQRRREDDTLNRVHAWQVVSP
jgi:hypothetical protein